MGKKRIMSIIVMGLLAVCTHGTMAPAADLIAIKNAARTALNAQDLDTFLSYFTEDAVFDPAPAPVAFKGKEQIRAGFQEQFKSFPDWHVTDPYLLAGGNLVVGEPVVDATQLGMWNGIPPTGNKVHVSLLEIVDFVGDKVKQVTIYQDMTGELVQLGAMAPAAPPQLVPSFTPPTPEPTGLAPVQAAVEAVTRWNAHDLAGYAKMVRSDAQVFIAPYGSVGREGWLAISELYFGGFPDFRLEITRQADLGEGWVLIEGVAKGTLQGFFAGLPPSGTPATVRTAILFHIDAQGRVDQMKDYYDSVSLLGQVAPKCPPAPAIPAYYIQDQITSPSLEGNLLGDPATRPLLVYLPPSYGKEPQRRYPTIYLLHGFGGDHTFFTSAGFLNVFLNALAGLDLNADLGQIVTELMASGQMGETIVVMPNATNAYGGSMYERSEVIGDYRTYVAKDLVAYIDGRYRTVADPNHRGIAGMSMGGDGALSLAIEYPEVFGAVAALGPGPVDRQMEPNEIDDFVTAFPVACGLPSMGSTLEDVWNMTLGNAMTTSVFYANAAAITPNPKKPPFFVDLPVKYPEKTAVPALWGAWVDRDLVHQVRQSGANFAKMPVLVVEGRGPTMLMAQVPGNDRLLAALYAKGVSYTYRAVPGDHLSGMRYQLSAALEFLYGHIAPRIEAK